MKNSVIALLMSGAAAQPMRGLGADKNVAAPKLIAVSWDDNKCTDDKVVAKLSEVTKQKTALDKNMKEVAAEKLKVDPLVADKAKKVAAVTAAHKTNDATIKASDDADLKLLNAQALRDTTQYSVDKCTADAATAAKAKAAADKMSKDCKATQDAAELNVKESKQHVIDEAADTKADKEAYDKEVKAHDALKKTSDADKKFYDAETAKVVVTQKAEDDGKKKWTASDALTAASKKIWEAQVKVQGTDKNDATSTAAKLTALALEKEVAAKKDVTTKGKAWADVGKQAVDEWKSYAADKAKEKADGSTIDGYTKKTAKFKCDKTTVRTAKATGDASLIKCTKACTGMPAFKASDATFAATTDCVAFDWDSSAKKCFTVSKKYPTVDNNDAQNDHICYWRNQTAFFVKYFNFHKTWSTAGSGVWKAYTDELPKWKPLVTTWENENAKLDIEKAVTKKFDEAYKALKVTSDKDKKDYKGVDGAGTHADCQIKKNTVAKGVEAGKKGSWEASDKLTVAGKVKLDASKKKYDDQVQEEKDQLAIQKLADSELLTVKGAYQKALLVVTTAKTGTDAVDTAAKAAKGIADKKLIVDAKAFGDAANPAKLAADKAKPLRAAMDLVRKASDDAEGLLVKAVTAWDNKVAAQKITQGLLDKATAAWTAQVVTCKETKYDDYKKTLGVAEKAQKDAIAKIEKMIADKVVAKPGEVGARCEKAPTLGDFKSRGLNPCKDMVANCCGAAIGTVGGAVMTVETCQIRTATKWSYQAPRTPLQTTWPAAKDWDWKCISGASQAAGAAVALVASAYMMA